MIDAGWVILERQPKGMMPPCRTGESPVCPHNNNLTSKGHTTMSSLMTNTAAMTALQTLRTVNADLATTQNRISTGFRVVDGLR